MMTGPDFRLAGRKTGLRSIRRHSLAILLASTAASTALGVVAAHAVDATWVGGNGGDPNEWVEPNNWTPATVPDGVATFTNTGVTTVANDNGIVVIGEVFFTGTPNAQAYTINIDNPFIVNATGIVNNSTNTQTFNVTSGNSLVFQNGSSASAGTGTGTVQINNQNGGFIVFQNASTAGTASIQNDSILQFNDSSTAGTAAITTTVETDFFNASSAAGATITNTGILTFNNTATAATSIINNNAAATLQFSNSTTAGSAQISNATTATMSFNDISTAGSSTISNSGALNFNNSSTGGSAQITNAITGTVTFADTSTAGTSTIGNSGALDFNNSATGGSAHITNATTGTVTFADTSTAGTSTIGNSGALNFNSSATAGSATITNSAPGALTFNNTATAGSANITNQAGATLTFNNNATAANAIIGNNGSAVFNNSATAGSAAITNAAAATLSFNNTATAGSAIIGNNGTMTFNNSATAENAVITTNSGGTVSFLATSTGGNAQFITNAGGTFNISGLTAAGMTAGSIAGAGSYILGAKNLAVGSNGLSTTVSGVISGVGGSLTKVGAGTLTLSGIDTYTGATAVNAGALIVDGSTASSSLTTVNAGGTLGGSGTVGNTAINGGILAPGSTSNPFGPLTVQGNLSFTAASTYMIQVSSANAGLTNVTGTAALGGATVSAVFSTASLQKQYKILTATGGLGGSTFNPTVVSNLANVQATLSYDPNDVFLNINLSFAPAGGALTVNQQNVANALTNFFNATGSLPASFAGLNAQGLTIASGELGTGIIQSSIKADDLFLNLLLDPTIAGRTSGFATMPGGATPFANQGTGDDAALSYAAKRAATPAERDAYAMATKAPPLALQPARPWSVWAAGYGGSETVGGNAVVGSQDLTARVWGIAAGADYKLAPDSLIGFALAGGGTSFSLANGLGSGSADLFQAGVYGRQNIGPAYLSAALAYGWHDVTTNRTVALAGVDQLQGRFRADTFSGRFEGGYRFATPFFGATMGITPYAAVQAISFNLPSYAEQSLTGGGLFALNYAAQTTTDTRTELGLRGDKSFAVQGGVLILRSRAAWAHDFDPNRAVTAIFQALPGASFVVNGARPDADSALVSAGAEMKWLNGFSLAGTFEGEFSGNVTSYAGKAVAKYSW
jgi:uncharacterized protein with beta-barrel porin domain